MSDRDFDSCDLVDVAIYQSLKSEAFFRGEHFLNDRESWSKVCIETITENIPLLRRSNGKPWPISEIERRVKKICNSKGLKMIYEDGYVFVFMGEICPPSPPKPDSPKRKFVLERDGNKCLKCGAESGLALDHVLPKSKGGSNRVSNLQVLCHKCNNEKGTDYIDYRKDPVPFERLFMAYEEPRVSYKTKKNS